MGVLVAEALHRGGLVTARGGRAAQQQGARDLTGKALTGASALASRSRRSRRRPRASTATILPRDTHLARCGVPGASEQLQSIGFDELKPAGGQRSQHRGEVLPQH